MEMTSNTQTTTRKLAYVPINVATLGSLFLTREQFVIIKSSLPDDAKFIFAVFDALGETLKLIYESDSFAPVYPGWIIPQVSVIREVVTFTRITDPYGHFC